MAQGLSGGMRVFPVFDWVAHLIWTGHFTISTLECPLIM